jgi:hypothetical protein
MKTRRQMLLRLYDDTQEQIQQLQTTSSAPASDAEEGGGSGGQPASLLAAELKDLTAIVAMLEAELARRGLLRTLN